MLFIRIFRPLHRSSGLCSPLERWAPLMNVASCPFTARAVYAHRSSGEHPDFKTNFACFFHPCHLSTFIIVYPFQLFSSLILAAPSWILTCLLPYYSLIPFDCTFKKTWWWWSLFHPTLFFSLINPFTLQAAFLLHPLDLLRMKLLEREIWEFFNSFSWCHPCHAILAFHSTKSD